MIDAKYAHTNLIADDWRALSDFTNNSSVVSRPGRKRVFGANHSKAGTGIPSARLRGVHLRLPGYGAAGPTLEIFSYNTRTERGTTAVDRPGFGHIAFSVADVADARTAVLQRGGQAIGKIVTLEVATGAKVTWCYVTDPEGNIIELQAWTA